MLELILVLFIAIFLAWCLSKYLSKVMANQPMVGDGLFVGLKILSIAC